MRKERAEDLWSPSTGGEDEVLAWNINFSLGVAMLDADTLQGA